MAFKNFIDSVALICAVAAAVVVGRTSLLKQTISTQDSLITALTQENKNLDERVAYLEAIINGDPGMVGKGNMASNIRCGCGNCAAPSKTPKNRRP